MRFLRVSLLLAAVVFLGLTGCRQEDDISRETVEHPDREKIGLRVAVIKQEPSVWFIKMVGPVKLMEEHGKTFEAFVRAVRFKANGEPILLTPPGWKKDLPTGRRFAGFRTGEKATEMEIAVTELPAKNFDLMVNMHRWQKQVNVPLTETHADLEKQVKKERIADHEVIWVDLQGGLGVHTVSKPPEPMPANAKNPFRGLDIKKPAAAGGDIEIAFSYVPPAGWVKKLPRKFLPVVFEIKDGAKSAEATLSSIGGTIGDNFNRWRGQVELPAIADGRAGAEERMVAGIKALYVDLANPQGPPAKNRILGVAIPVAGQPIWFVKMTGPIDFVGEHKDEFEAFVKSFKLEGR